MTEGERDCRDDVAQATDDEPWQHSEQRAEKRKGDHGDLHRQRCVRLGLSLTGRRILGTSVAPAPQQRLAGDLNKGQSGHGKSESQEQQTAQHTQQQRHH